MRTLVAILSVMSVFSTTFAFADCTSGLIKSSVQKSEFVIEATVKQMGPPAPGFPDGNSAFVQISEVLKVSEGLNLKTNSEIVIVDLFLPVNAGAKSILLIERALPQTITAGMSPSTIPYLISGTIDIECKTAIREFLSVKK